MSRHRLGSGPLIPDWFGPEYPTEWNEEPTEEEPEEEEAQE